MSLNEYIYSDTIKCNCELNNCNKYHNNGNKIDFNQFRMTSKNNWIIERFEELEKFLNGFKAQTGQFPAKEWYHLTETNEISSEFKNEILKNIFQDRYSLVTRAWIKFYEILDTFNVFSPKTGDNTICGLFLCEGNFIFNFYFQ